MSPINFDQPLESRYHQTVNADIDFEITTKDKHVEFDQEESRTSHHDEVIRFVALSTMSQYSNLSSETRQRMHQLLDTSATQPQEPASIQWDEFVQVESFGSGSDSY